MNVLQFVIVSLQVDVLKKKRLYQRATIHQTASLCSLYYVTHILHRRIIFLFLQQYVRFPSYSLARYRPLNLRTSHPGPNPQFGVPHTQQDEYGLMSLVGEQKPNGTNAAPQ
jgi:hypothetical protein